MVSILLGFKQIWSIIVKIGKRPDTRAILVTVLSLLFLGTLFFTLYEGFTVLDSLYLCVVTLMTIGYGDIVPITSLGKLFTIVYSFLGVGIVGVLAGIFAREFLSNRHIDIQNSESFEDNKPL